MDPVTGPVPPAAAPAAPGASGPPPPPPQPQQSSVLKAGWVWVNQAQDMGMIASRALLFIIAAIALFALSGGLGVLMMGAVRGDQSSEAALAIPIMLRGGEILLTMAAALLVFLVILSREGDAILTLLGVLVIAAIIIPMQDLMKIAAFVGRPEHEFVEQASNGGRSNFVSRNVSDASAERALHHLRTNEDTRDTFAELSIRDVQKITTQLARVLYRIDIEMLEAAVRTRALERQLRDSLDEPRMRQIGMMPNMVRQLRADYLALRDMGLISMPPGELHNVIVTTLGVEVLCRITPLDSRVAEEAHRRGLTRPSAAEPRCEPRIIRGPEETTVPGTSAATGTTSPSVTVAVPRVIALDFPSINSREGHVLNDVQVPAGGAAQIEFSVPAGESFSALIETGNPRRGLDPYLTLVGPDNAILAEDDDSGGELNSRIVRSLGSGRYRIRLTDFASGSGSANLTVRRATPEERLVGFDIRSQALDAELLSLAADTTACGRFVDPASPALLELENGNRLLRCSIASAGSWTFEARPQSRAIVEMAIYRVTNTGAVTLVDWSSSGGQQQSSVRITGQLAAGEVVLRIRQRSALRTSPVDLRITSPQP